MQILKYLGFGLCGLIGLGLLAFGIMIFSMREASKSGRSKISTLEKEFAVGRSIDGLIDRAEAVGINSLYWDTDKSKESFEDNSGIPSTQSEKIERPGLDFKMAKDKFRLVNTGEIQLLAYGSFVLERFILSIEFVDRKITKTSFRIID